MKRWIVGFLLLFHSLAYASLLLGFPFPSGTPYTNTKSSLFTGTEYVDMGASANLDFNGTQPYSISFWVKLNATSGANTVLGRLNSGNNYAGPYYVNINASVGVLSWQMANNENVSNYLSITSVSTIPNLTWKHIVLTYDGSKDASGMKEYFDGSIISTITGVNTLTGSTVSGQNGNIGRDTYNAEYFHGNVDELAFFSGVLSSSQVTEIYNLGHPGNIKATTASGSLLTWLRMGDPPDSTSTFFDNAGANNATPVNFISSNISSDVP